MPTLTLPLPADLDESAARLSYALGLFQEGHVSLGKAAEIAGLPYRAFLDALHHRGIPAYTYTEEMLEEDLALARTFRREREP
jgi:predicted HTH domain antitoxin